MYTLINRTKTLCTGIFPNRDTAARWAQKHIPALGLEPIELLLHGGDADGIVEAGLLTEGNTTMLDSEPALPTRVH